MARQARQMSKSGNYYIVLRGQELFVTKADKEKFLEIAQEKLEGGRVYGVEITKTEIRMVVKEGGKGISMNMKSITTVYARYFNRANNREGKIFEGRFRSEPLESKKEVEECVAGLKTAKVSVPKKAETPPKTVPKKTVPKQEKKEEPAPKPQPKKNLPSWLL